jgi:hypothetical protein
MSNIDNVPSFRYFFWVKFVFSSSHFFDSGTKFGDLSPKLSGHTGKMYSVVGPLDFKTLGYQSGLPDFSGYNIPKREKYTKMTTNFTNWQ